MRRTAFTTANLQAIRFEGLIRMAELARRAGMPKETLHHYLPRRNHYVELGLNPGLFQPIVSVLRDHIAFLDDLLWGGDLPLNKLKIKALKKWKLIHYKRVECELKPGRPPQVLIEHLVLLRVLLRDIPAIPAELEPNIRARMVKNSKRKYKWDYGESIEL